MKIPPVFYTYICIMVEILSWAFRRRSRRRAFRFTRAGRSGGFAGRSCPLQSLTRRGVRPLLRRGGCTGSGFRTFFREKLRKTPKTGPSGRSFSVVFWFFSDKKPLFYTCNVLIHSEDEKNKKNFSHSVACKGKAVFLQSRFARHTNGAREGGCAPARGARGETGGVL